MAPIAATGELMERVQAENQQSGCILEGDNICVAAQEVATEGVSATTEKSSIECEGPSVDKDAEKGSPIDENNVTTPKDPNIVDWDGPDDPENPRNWPKSQKMTNIILVSLSVLYCSLATTMFAPAANIMQEELGYYNDSVEVLTITIASLGFALGQLFVGPASEVFGRVPVYRTSAIFYLGFTAGCAQSTHVAEFLVFRLLTGIAAASYLSTGGGTIADVLPKEQRGAAMAIYTSGPLFGPVLGPIVGGFVTESLGWRWTFYLVLMLAGVITAVSIVCMHESSAVILLRAKVARLRKETGNTQLRAAGDEQVPVKLLIFRALARPTRFLVMSPVVLLMSLYVAFIFGLTMLLFATFPAIFEETYGWSVGISGLSYAGVGVGCGIGIFIFAKFSDRLLKAEGGKYRAERRLIMMMYVSPLLPVSVVVYGWSTQYGVHWIVPILATTIAGPGAVIITSSTQTYIIDIFGPQAAASALGAVTLVRNVTGAFMPLAAPSLYANLGLGWGNSLLAFLFFLFIPMPFFFYWRGEWLRKKFPVTM